MNRLLHLMYLMNPPMDYYDVSISKKPSPVYVPKKQSNKRNNKRKNK